MTGKLNIPLFGILILAVIGNCAVRYTPEIVKDSIPATEDNLINVQLERDSLEDNGFYKQIVKSSDSYQVLTLSSNRMEILIDSISLVQGDSNQALDLFLDTSFKRIEEGTKWELIEENLLPDGNYTHLRFTISALKLHLPARIMITEEDNPGPTDCASNDLTFTYYLNDVPSNAEIGRGEIEVVVECIKKKWEFWTATPDLLFVGQEDVPNSIFTEEFDRPIRVIDSEFGERYLKLLMAVEKSLTFYDYNFNQSLDLSLDEIDGQMVLTFREKLNFFPWFDIKMVEEVPEVHQKESL
jgi:hypothetical protein